MPEMGWAQAPTRYTILHEPRETESVLWPMHQMQRTSAGGATNVHKSMAEVSGEKGGNRSVKIDGAVNDAVIEPPKGQVLRRCDRSSSSHEKQWSTLLSMKVKKCHVAISRSHLELDTYFHT